MPQNTFYEHNHSFSIQHLLIELFKCVRHHSWPLVLQKKNTALKKSVSSGEIMRRTYNFRNVIFDLNSKEVKNF